MNNCGESSTQQWMIIIRGFRPDWRASMDRLAPALAIHLTKLQMISSTSVVDFKVLCTQILIQLTALKHHYSVWICASYICHLKCSHCWGFLWWSVVKNLPFNAGDMGSITGWETKIPHAPGQLSSKAQN